MRQAYYMILFGILFIRFNFYLAFSGIDLLPDSIGYLLLLMAAHRLQSYHRNASLQISIGLCIFFLINEFIKPFYYPFMFLHVYAAFFISLFLMTAQIALYVLLLRGLNQLYPFPRYQICRWTYIAIASSCMVIYLWLCFFGGYLYLMNLASFIETLCLLCLFFFIGRHSTRSYAARRLTKMNL